LTLPGKQNERSWGVFLPSWRNRRRLTKPICRRERAQCSPRGCCVSMLMPRRELLSQGQAAGRVLGVIVVQLQANCFRASRLCLWGHSPGIDRQDDVRSPSLCLAGCIRLQSDVFRSTLKLLGERGCVLQAHCIWASRLPLWERCCVCATRRCVWPARSTSLNWES
jgi:hypothetical protein